MYFPVGNGGNYAYQSNACEGVEHVKVSWV